MYICDKCEKEFQTVSEIANHNRWHHKKEEIFACECKKEFKDKSSYVVHKKYCDGTGTKIDKKNKDKNWVCPLCNIVIKTSRKRHLAYCNGLGPRRLRPKVTGRGKAWNKGYTKETCESIRIASEKVSRTLKGRPWKAKNPEAWRKRISETMKKNPLAGGRREGSGRGIKGKRNGIWCDSSWELAYIIYCEDHSIKFERNTERFYYEFEGKQHYYIPDFIIDGEYIEIKGRRNYDKLSKKCKAKVSSFPKQLKILFESEMKPILEYVTNRYGSDFYLKMYDK